MKRTSLSGGLWIYQALSESEEVMEKVTKIFPLVTDTAELPYICYRRSGGSYAQNTTRPRDTAQVEVWCYAATYEESVDLAEMAREAIEGNREEAECGLTAGPCWLSGSEELWEDDAFIQKLVFEIKID